MKGLEALKKVTYTLANTKCEECHLKDICELIVMSEPLKDSEFAVSLCGILAYRLKRLEKENEEV